MLLFDSSCSERDKMGVTDREGEFPFNNVTSFNIIAPQFV
jgi:hypothetical protein